ncbi:two-component system regulatory protein YycI [Paenibacillus sp. MBLB4367]|uniref:two-component system regulatory protein YycI n=1 Tax=Paenibacillus sp. MBLB4367 TaxID=3384767 RepID=UPI0039084393
MDWGRAKTILIVSFLFLNVLLGYQLWVTRFSQTYSETDTASIIEETNKLLAIKNIRVLADVPKDTPKLGQITVKLPEKYRDAKKVTLQQPIKYVNLISRSGLKEVIAKLPVENATAYKLDTALSRDDEYVFYQMMTDMPLFDATLHLYGQKGEINGFKQTKVEVQSGGEHKEQKVISAYTAIRSLAENLPEGSVIADVRLGYHGQQFDSETQVLLPTWRVVLAEGGPYYVQAFNGELERPQEQRK